MRLSCLIVLGDTFRFGFHYQIFGYEVWLGEALLSLCAMVLVGLLCAKSARAPGAIITVASFVFAASFIACAVAVLLRHDSAFSFEPLYTEFNATSGYEGLNLAKQGDDFFVATYEDSLNVVHPEDLALFHTSVTKEHILSAIEKDGVFALDYRLVADGIPNYVRLKAAQIVEDGKPMLIVGLLDEDAQVRHEQEYERNLTAAQNLALRDGLTGVKNKHAYVNAERELNQLIDEDDSLEFAVVICDINDLKRVNDTLGHKAGDRYIRDACAVICNSFKHSPVFRIGGDEFAVICRGHDYEHAEEILRGIEEGNERGTHGSDGVQIACGMARFEGDLSVEEVFERADRLMYQRKAQMKAVG